MPTSRSRRPFCCRYRHAQWEVAGRVREGETEAGGAGQEGNLANLALTADFRGHQRKMRAQKREWPSRTSP